MGAHGKTSMNVGALVTLGPAVHYFYMREYWVQIGHSPTFYRYIGWLITLFMQTSEFNFILSVAQSNPGSGMFWRILVGTVAMSAFGYVGGAGSIEQAPASSLTPVGGSTPSTRPSRVRRARWLPPATGGRDREVHRGHRRFRP